MAPRTGHGPRKVSLSVTIDLECDEWLRNAAIERGETMSSIVNMMIRDELELDELVKEND